MKDKEARRLILELRDEFMQLDRTLWRTVFMAECSECLEHTQHYRLYVRREGTLYVRTVGRETVGSDGTLHRPLEARRCTKCGNVFILLRINSWKKVDFKKEGTSNGS